jgi:hypothetical protein
MSEYLPISEMTSLSREAELGALRVKVARQQRLLDAWAPVVAGALRWTAAGNAYADLDALAALTPEQRSTAQQLVRTIHAAHERSQ